MQTLLWSTIVASFSFFFRFFHLASFLTLQRSVSKVCDKKIWYTLTETLSIYFLSPFPYYLFIFWGFRESSLLFHKKNKNKPNLKRTNKQKKQIKIQTTTTTTTNREK